MSTAKSPDLSDLPAVCPPPPSVDSRCLDPACWSSVLPVTRSPLQARRLGVRGPAKRRAREMVPPEKKDAAYKSKRLKNNEAAKRSRDKRRMKDLLLEGQLLALSHENARLRTQILRLRRLGVQKENVKAAPRRDPGPGSSPVGPRPPIWGGGSGFPSSWIRGFDALVPLPGPRGLSALTGTEEGSASMSADPSSVRAFPRPEAFRPGPPAWLLPGPAVGGDFPSPWLPPYLVATAPYPSLCSPLCMQAARGQGGDAPVAFTSRLAGALTPYF